ncbi:ribonuclease G [Abditibacteriota bacterium]|nr:ribonuclease G [Abditibacteriota bacterium]
MSRLFLVNVEAPEIRVAEVRDGRLFDLDIERDTRLLGSIYKGRVENVVPGMDAAFVDIGLKRNALLYVGDIIGGAGGATIGTLLKPRQELLVQIARPPVGTKGARVTTRLSLPGRTSILVVGSETVGVSKRIESEEERARLRRIADRLRPLDHGLIIRTEAEGASENTIAADLATLGRQLAALISKGRDMNAPALIHEDLGLLGRVARDRLSEDVTSVLIDSRAVYEAFTAQVRAFSPLLAQPIQFYSEATPLFERFGVADDVRVAGERAVPLRGGGSLVIDEAEALTAIDVNSGSHVSKKGLNDTAVQVNLGAVEEIARQLRVRDLGGVIVVDFIDMEKTRDRVRVLNTLEQALKDDRGRTRIVQISPSGLVEMTRRREGQSLQKVLGEACPRCLGTGFVPRGETLGVEARRRARQMALESVGTGVLIIAHPETACHILGEDGEWLADLESETGARIRLRVDEDRPENHIDFERIMPSVPLARDLTVGAMMILNLKWPFYPRESPRYAVLGETLVALDAIPESKSGTLLVEIKEVGRHVARGHIAGEGK